MFQCVCGDFVQIIISVAPTLVDHLLSVQMLEAVSVFLGINCPHRSCRQLIHMVVPVNTFYSLKLLLVSIYCTSKLKFSVTSVRRHR